MKIRMQVNGAARELETEPMRRLLDVLREDCGLTGTKEGCGEGECGACTVLIDGKPVNSCLVPVGQVHEAELLTVEGLSDGELLTDVQRALVEHGGAQCGICTPGIAVTAESLIRREKNLDHARIRELLAGNLCRCTGYQRVVEAVAEAAAKRGGAGDE